MGKVHDEDFKISRPALVDCVPHPRIKSIGGRKK
jgi:hypothetical protein